MCKRCDEMQARGENMDPTAGLPIADRIAVKLDACIGLMEECYGLAKTFGASVEHANEGVRLSPLLTALVKRYHDGDRSETFETDIVKVGDDLVKFRGDLGRASEKLVTLALLDAILGGPLPEQAQAPAMDPSRLN